MTTQLEWQLTRLRTTHDAQHRKWGALGYLLALKGLKLIPDQGEDAMPLQKGTKSSASGGVGSIQGTDGTTTARLRPPLPRQTPAVDGTVPEEDREPKDDDTAPVGTSRATGAASPREAEIVAQVWAQRYCILRNRDAKL